MTAWENLVLAYRKAARGKRGRPPAAAFEFQLADRLIELQAELENGTYRPGEYRHFIIHEPKRRRISAAPFRDRVVHHALGNVIDRIRFGAVVDFIQWHAAGYYWPALNIADLAITVGAILLIFSTLTAANKEDIA